MNGRPGGLGAKEIRLETTTSVWKFEEDPDEKVKGMLGFNARPGGLGAKETRLETTTNVWKCEEEPNAKVQKTKLECTCIAT